ncbi:MAG TPA: glycosyltransferase [Candidatus Saccharimonadales bacterium]|nr:glycosyltransferase [Candidatus Saccharimonadales bacterium]
MARTINSDIGSVVFRGELIDVSAKFSLSGEQRERNLETVSVLVPSYNHGYFVARCLRSIITQTHRPLQLIVIDDGSDDDSVRTIERELKACPFESELVANTHNGLIPTLNEGLARSRGKYFAYLASDDVWLPEFLASRVKLLGSRTDAVLAYGHSFVIDEEDRIVECTKDWADYGSGSAREMLLKVIVPFSPSVLYRRDALNQWNEDTELEDYDLYLRLSSKGEFAFDEGVLCAWRKHSKNNSRRLEFMLRECLQAQRRAVASLGLTPFELKRAHARLQWLYGSDFVKAGQKSRGLELLCSSLKGAPSYSSIARMIGALILPTSISRWRRRHLEEKNVQRYGTLTSTRRAIGFTDK